LSHAPRASYEVDMVAGPGPSWLRDPDALLCELRRLLCGRLGITAEQLTPESPLESIGVDSVELAFILARFERDTGLTFEDPEADVSRYITIADITDLLADKLSDAGRGTAADA
jgi:acyl carrier protein